MKRQPRLQKPKEQLALREKAGARRGSESPCDAARVQRQPFPLPRHHLRLCEHSSPARQPTPCRGKSTSQEQGSNPASGHLARGDKGAKTSFLRSSPCDVGVPGGSLDLKHLNTADK